MHILLNDTLKLGVVSISRVCAVCRLFGHLPQHINLAAHTHNTSSLQQPRIGNTPLQPPPHTPFEQAHQPQWHNSLTTRRPTHLQHHRFALLAHGRRTSWLAANQSRHMPSCQQPRHHPCRLYDWWCSGKQTHTQRARGQWRTSSNTQLVCYLA